VSKTEQRISACAGHADPSLQRKGDRESLKEAVSLRAGEVYVSRIDLNRDNGAIETPHVPVLRVATPLHAPDGRPFGIVIINVDMRQAFAAIRSVERDGGHIYVVNDLGDYLVHPDRQREFGFEFGSPARVQDDFPEFAEILARDDTAPRVVRDHAGARFGVGWETVRPAGGPSITVIEATPYAWLMTATTAIRNASLLGGLAAVLGGFVLAIVLARSLTRPLVQMTRAVEGFARDEPMAVPTAASGEIGVLARQALSQVRACAHDSHGDRCASIRGRRPIGRRRNACGMTLELRSGRQSGARHATHQPRKAGRNARHPRSAPSKQSDD
jgi:hypothetical protein